MACISFKNANGRAVYKNLKVFVGIPAGFASQKVEKVENATNLWTNKYVTLGEVAEQLGSKVR